MNKNNNEATITREEFDSLMKRFELVEEYCMDLAEAQEIRVKAIKDLAKKYPSKKTSGTSTCQ
jgi:hypothetical protein